MSDWGLPQGVGIWPAGPTDLVAFRRLVRRPRLAFRADSTGSGCLPLWSPSGMLVSEWGGVRRRCSGRGNAVAISSDLRLGEWLCAMLQEMAEDLVGSPEVFADLSGHDLAICARSFADRWACFFYECGSALGALRDVAPVGAHPLRDVVVQADGSLHLVDGPPTSLSTNWTSDTSVIEASLFGSASIREHSLWDWMAMQVCLGLAEATALQAPLRVPELRPELLPLPDPTKSNASRVAAFYNERVAGSGALDLALWGEEGKRSLRIRRVTDLIDRLQPASLMDIGCADGAFLGELRRRLPRVELSGIDLVASLVEKARALPGVHASVQEYATMPASGPRYAAVTALGVIGSPDTHGPTELSGLLAVGQRILLEGGHLVVSINVEPTSQQAAWVGLDQLPHLIGTAYRDVWIEEIGPGFRNERILILRY